MKRSLIVLAAFGFFASAVRKRIQQLRWLMASA